MNIGKLAFFDYNDDDTEVKYQLMLNRRKNCKWVSVK